MVCRRTPKTEEHDDDSGKVVEHGVTRDRQRTSHKRHHTNIERGTMNLILTPPLLGFIAGTRATLGLGLGLLLADRIPESRRRSLGIMLVAIGAATTIPAAVSVFRRRVTAELPPSTSQTPPAW